MRFDYVATPWPPDAPDPQPELRAELEEVGFRVLGGCAIAPGSTRAVATIARDYGDRADDLATWATAPGMVLTSPDGTTFAHLAWLWDCRYGTLTTVLADGAVVQTTADWRSLPARPTALDRHANAFDPITEQLSLTSDRHTEIVPGSGQDLWEAHSARLARIAPPVVAPHTELADFVAVYGAESRARSRWVARMQVVALLLAFVVVLVPFTVVNLLLGAQPWWADAGLVGAAGVASLLLHRRLYVRARRWRALRPAARVPVPGAVRSAS